MNDDLTGISTSAALKSVFRFQEQMNSALSPYQGLAKTLDQAMYPYAGLVKSLESSLQPLDGLSTLNDAIRSSAIDITNEMLLDQDSIRSLSSVIEEIASLSHPMAGIRSIINSVEANYVDKISSIISDFDDSSLFNNLHHIIRQIDLESLREIGVFSSEYFSDEILHEIEHEIEAAVTEPVKFIELSPKARGFLVFIIVHVMIPLFIGLSGNIAFDVWKDYQQKQSISKAIDVKEVRQILREELSSSVLTHFRVVSGNNLRLRDRPSMKSETITLLSIGTPVQIIDNSNRSWLLVEVQIDEKLITGWVSRRYTKRLH